jgi:hypothetical protein
MERSSFLSSGVKFALQVLLRDVEIEQIYSCRFALLFADSGYAQ